MLGLLRRTPGYRLLIVVLLLVAVGAVAMLSLRGCGSGYEIDPAERYVVERATENAAEALSAKLPMRTVLLMPLAGDDDGYVTMQLTDRLEAVGDFEVYRKKDLGAFETILAKVKAFMNDVLGTGRLADVRAAPALEAAKRVSAPAVIFGKVTERTAAGGRTKVGIALRAVKTDDGNTILAKAFEADVRRSFTSGAYRRIWMRSRAWWGRLLLWAGLVALLPLVTGRFARPLLARESNAVNAAVMGLYLVFDVLLAWLLLGCAGGGAVVILLVLGAVAGGVYAYVICDRLSATE